MTQVEHIRGETYHGRKGAVTNSFRYGVDYVLLDPETARGPRLFSRNRANLTSLHDRDHGGVPGQGQGVAWVRRVLADHQLAASRVQLLAQPRVLGHVFNPVSFWLCWSGADLTAVIAEVTNTYGERHSYLCAHPHGAPIQPADTLQATKIFYVSPFQPVTGRYDFRFDIRPDRIGIWIDYTSDKGGVFTNLIGPRVALTNAGIIWASLRRPFGSRRVLALIHWQALKLAIKGAKFRTRPTPPVDEVTR
ncbi:MAG: hypothetical protein RLZZ437_1015 [Pseudomonadota bacterium]|jgi:DUF1365 family protein